MYERYLEDEEVVRLRKRTWRWIIALLINIVLWIALLTGNIVLYDQYKVTCESNNTFGKYALALSVYVLLKNLLDISMAGVCLHRIKLYKKAEIMPRWDRALRASRDTLLDNEEYGEGYGMITDKVMTSSNIAVLMDMASTVREKRIEEELLMDFYNKQRGLEEKITSNRETLKQALLHLPKWTSKKTRNLNAAAATTTTPGVSKLLFGTSAVPVLAILFFIITGTDAVASIRQHLGTTEKDLPHICTVSLSLYWTVLTYGLILNILQAAPLIKILLCRKRPSSSLLLLLSQLPPSDITSGQQREETGHVSEA